ncbi:MAG TPA: thiamine pyrophosphate-dependent dehydrogenase E1 component subunit alpha [Solirubrobacteraceae bacterium]|nr:thiamine pyrophosphate-dependent dehydrogenase E1 component subunit alpha [Solirubrobacteraceae bacterium]
MSETTTQVRERATGDADLLRAMLEIRFFEDHCHELFAAGLLRGATHLGQGQEAVSVGFCRALGEGDTMTCTYRGHAATLAMGAPIDRAFGEMLGRQGGLCDGKGGSMHLTDVSVGALGAFGVVGAHLPISVGAAFAAKYRRSGAVNVCFFGDGATNIGAFHESLNFASIMKLPLIFVCENNLYGEYSPLAKTTPIERLADRAASYGMHGERIDGNEVQEVLETARRLVSRAREGGGPALVEAMTYRQKGHARSDPGAYRPPGELEEWLERDPLTLLEARMLSSGSTREELESLRTQVKEEVDAALARAQSWPEPPAGARFEDVLAA